MCLLCRTSLVEGMQAHKVPVVPGLVWNAMTHSGLTIKAAQLQHRLPCWGYVMEEQASHDQPGRKVVLLGDTCDSQAIEGVHCLQTFDSSRFFAYALTALPGCDMYGGQHDVQHSFLAAWLTSF